MMRYARYAAAVLFALLAVAFVALWVVSYQSAIQVDGPLNLARHDYLHVLSTSGVVSFSYETDFDYVNGWKVVTLPAGGSLRDYGPLGFRLLRGSASMPHWFLAASSLALAALFAFKRTWRYSLRSILVATTIAAATLGLAVHALQ